MPSRNTKAVISEKRARDFFSFVYERQRIWYRREIQKREAPWTDDELLQTYKFINMYRELDRCTKYIMNVVESLHADREALLLNFIFYRFFNLDHLYEDLGVAPFKRLDAKTHTRLVQGFSRMREKGKPLFNNAYVISPGHDRSPKHLTILKGLRVVSASIQGLIKQIDAAETPEDAFLEIQTVPLVGPFLACEIWTDFSYVDGFVQGWTDNDFVNVGPGAKWGLELLAGQKLTRSDQQRLLQWLHQKQEDVLPAIHKVLGATPSWETISYQEAASNTPFLSLTNVEGALCEYRKYLNLSSGKGRRRYFEPSDLQARDSLRA
ncbi:MAG: hypothetical protein KC653_03020 [Candidatus Andersenbacteria bacterium]|nr:hypothetical protein [Candidatus Andersenbacteria bacterium]